MNHPTLRTLARLLAPWRAIRRLEQEAREAKQEAEQLRVERDAAQEAVRRLIVPCYDSEVRHGVHLWATRDGMTGPLPPLPEWLVGRKRGEQGHPQAEAL